MIALERMAHQIGKGASLYVHLLRLLDFGHQLISASCTRKVVRMIAFQRDDARSSTGCCLLTNKKIHLKKHV